MYECFPKSDAPKEADANSRSEDAQEAPEQEGPSSAGRAQGCRDFLRAAIRYSGIFRTSRFAFWTRLPVCEALSKRQGIASLEGVILSRIVVGFI
jgi:hypothetical protein